MDECEALCNRISIMKSGEIRAIGTPNELKHKYGDGYTAVLKLHGPDAVAPAIEFLNKTLQGECMDGRWQRMKFRFRHDHVRDILTAMEEIRGTYADDYEVTVTTLEDVFMAFSDDRRTLDDDNIGEGVPVGLPVQDVAIGYPEGYDPQKSTAPKGSSKPPQEDSSPNRLSFGIPEPGSSSSPRKKKNRFSLPTRGSSSSSARGSGASGSTHTTI